jgi:YfiH family protein
MAEPRPGGGFVWAHHAPAPAFVCRPLAEAAHHLYTTRAWRLGSRPEEVDEAWAELAAAVGVAPDQLVRARQVHGREAVVVRRGDRTGRGPAGDADILTTDDPSRALAVQAADCAPILLADRATGAVAAAHAGWRGLAAGVPAAAVQAMVDAWGSRPADLVAAVGPSIGACCYEVGSAVHEAFVAAGFSRAAIDLWFGVEHRPGHWQFDGWASARDQLAAAGVPDDRIHLSRLCTGCFPDRLCSYRRQGAAAGRMAALVRAGVR